MSNVVKNAFAAGTIAVAAAMPSGVAALDKDAINRFDPQAPTVSSVELNEKLKAFQGNGAPAAAAHATASGTVSVPLGSAVASGDKVAMSQLQAMADQARARAGFTGGTATGQPAGGSFAERFTKGLNAASPSTAFPVDPTDAQEAIAKMGQKDAYGRKVTTVTLTTPNGAVNVVDPNSQWAKKIVSMDTAVASLTSKPRTGGYATDSNGDIGHASGSTFVGGAANGYATNKVTKSNCDLKNPNGINEAAGGAQQGSNSGCKSR